MPARDYELLALYWIAEPWGAYRDNLHAAIIAAQVSRPHLKKGKSISVMDFMLRSPDDVEAEQAERRKRATANLVQLFRSIAVKKVN